MDKPNYTYSWVPCSDLFTHGEELLNKMAHLYSNHYGIWSSRSPHKPGDRIRLSSNKIRTWVNSDDTKIAMTHYGEELIGYAIAVQTKVPRYGVVSWVTQFVIHEDHRNMGIGKALLFCIWGFSDHFSWGLVTANPYAIRALEKATRRRCDSQRIAKNHRKLIAIGSEHTTYIQPEMECSINMTESKVNTEFYLDHSELKAMLESVVTEEKPWKLGSIDEGWEWFAFTFNDQNQIGLTSDEIMAMLEVSDDVVKQAYSRMLISSTAQKWTQHSQSEAAFIADTCNLTPGSKILDFGCGVGRHSIALAKMNFEVTGVDNIPEFVNMAELEKMQSGLRLEFVLGDCRNINLNRKYDLVICLYDVIGSYADNSFNVEIVRNITSHLDSGGKAIISVMNYELTRSRAKFKFRIASEHNKLLDLPASHTMERTGDVFDPDYYMIDEDTQVVYRKEQFSAGNSLPVELIVRDRRFIKEEIENICSEAGLNVIWTRFVRAGLWERSLDRGHDRAKEILLYCEKE